MYARTRIASSRQSASVHACVTFIYYFSHLATAVYSNISRSRAKWVTIRKYSGFFYKDRTTGGVRYLEPI